MPPSVGQLYPILQQPPPAQLGPPLQPVAHLGLPDINVQAEPEGQHPPVPSLHNVSVASGHVCSCRGMRAPVTIAAACILHSAALARWQPRATAKIVCQACMAGGLGGLLEIKKLGTQD